MERRIFRIWSMVFTLVLFATFSAYGIQAPDPEVMEKWKAEGIYEKKMKSLREFSRKMFGPGKEQYRDMPSEGDLHALVVLVEFDKGGEILLDESLLVRYYAGVGIKPML